MSPEEKRHLVSWAAAVAMTILFAWIIRQAPHSAGKFEALIVLLNLPALLLGGVLTALLAGKFADKNDPFIYVLILAQWVLFFELLTFVLSSLFSKRGKTDQ